MKRKLAIAAALVVLMSAVFAPLVDPFIQGFSTGKGLAAFFDGTSVIPTISVHSYMDYYAALFTSEAIQKSFVFTLAIIAMAATLLVAYTWQSENSSVTRNSELGDARIIENPLEIRRKNDWWNGKEAPKKAGLVLGSTKRGYYYESASPHAVCVGKTGSGKSQLMCLETAHLTMAAGWNLIVSGKNEIYELTADKAEELGYNVFHLDLSGYPMANRFNPIDIVTDYHEKGQTGKAVKAAREAAEAILPKNPRESNPYFTDAARSALTAMILAVCMSTEATREQKNMASVASMIIHGTGGKGNDPAKQLRAYFEKLGENHPAYMAARDFLSDGGQTTAGKNVVTNLQLAVSIFTDENVRDITAESAFSFDEIIQEKSVVYIGLPEENDPYMPVFTCFFQQYWMKAKEAALGNGGRLPHETAIIGDEFGNLPRLSCIPEIITLGRSYKIHAYLFVQNLKQLNKYDVPGDGGAGHEKILGSSGIQVALSLAAPEDARYFSRLCGKKTVVTYSSTTQRNQIGHSSQGSSQTSVDLVKEWEWSQRSPIRDGAIVVKGAENSRPGHEGVFRMPLRYASQTIANGFFDLGSEQYESYLKQRFYAERWLDSRGRFYEASVWTPDLRPPKKKGKDKKPEAESQDQGQNEEQPQQPTQEQEQQLSSECAIWDEAGK